MTEDDGQLRGQTSGNKKSVTETEEKADTVELVFPYLGCEVNKIVDDVRRPYLNGRIREIDGDNIKVWWHMDWELNRNGKPIKDKGEELAREKWSLCHISELCPRPLAEAREMKRCKHIEARNQKFIDQAIRIQRARDGQESGVRSQESEAISDQPTLSDLSVSLLGEMGLSEAVSNQPVILQPARPEPYHAKTNPPRKGDRIRTGQGKTGEITEVRATNPKYTIRWENQKEGSYTFRDLEIMDIRREG
jgi:hypothetical protein